MRKNHVIALLPAILFSANVFAGKPPPQPDVPQDVTVVNTTPIPVEVQGGITIAAEPRFVGFSDSAVRGDVGLVGLHGACRDTYGPGARMCLSIEVFKTPDLESIQIPGFDRGWIAPQILDIGNVSAERFDCFGWYGLTEAKGLTLLADSMAIVPDYCSTPFPVACCQ